MKHRRHVQMCTETVRIHHYDVLKELQIVSQQL